MRYVFNINSENIYNIVAQKICLRKCAEAFQNGTLIIINIMLKFIYHNHTNIIAWNFKHFKKFLLLPHGYSISHLALLTNFMCKQFLRVCKTIEHTK